MVRPVLVFGELLGLFDDFGSEGRRVSSKVFLEDLSSGEPGFQPGGIADGSKRSFEENAIKTGYNAFDSAFVPFQKTLHGVPPVLGKHIMDENRGASLF